MALGQRQALLLLWGPKQRSALGLILGLLLLGAGPADDTSEFSWSVRCEPREPCLLRVNGETALRTARGALRCAEKNGTLGCLFSSRNGRRHEAWFVHLADRAIQPIRIDAGQAVLARPVWDPDGLRIMLRRADGSLGTRTVVPPEPKPDPQDASRVAGWAAVVGSVDDAPAPVRLATGAEGFLFTLAGPRFALRDGSAAGEAVWSDAGRAGLLPVDLDLLPGGDVVLLARAKEGAAGFHGLTPVRVVGGGRGGGDLLLLRISAAGEVRWRRVWGSAGEDLPFSVEAEAGLLRVRARYAGLVDLDPEEKTKLITPAPSAWIESRFDLDGHLLDVSETGPDVRVDEEVPPECQTTSAAPAAAPEGTERAKEVCRCRLKLGVGSVPRSARTVDLRSDPDQASSWVGCFLEGVPSWILVAPVGVTFEDAREEGALLCLGGQARGGPHDLSPRPGSNLWIGVPEVESVAFVACLPLADLE